MTPSARIISTKLLLPLLASIMAVSPLAIDLYLPAMPQLASALHTDMPAIQNTLSIYLVGYAMGLLFFGPLADKYPRRHLVLLGLIGFLVATVALLFASNIETFLAMRFIQAFVSSAATVVVPGTIREVYQHNTAKGLSYVSMIMMLAPMIAPSIGSVILLAHSWEAIFICLSLYAVAVLLCVYFFLPNSSTSVSTEQVSFLGRYKIVLANKGARLELFASMLVSLAFFAYITAIPFVYLTVFGLSEFWFSILFAANVLALMSAHFINSKLVTRKGSRRMFGYGVVVATLASSSLVLVNYLALPLFYTVLSILPLMGSISMVAVNADALVLQNFAHQSGTATAVIGVLRFGVGGFAGPILAYFYDGSALPFSLLMWCSVLLVVAAQMPRIFRERKLSKA
ncbi:multidrug effflux MFS transporter [Colwellia sp. MEBiC06753]